VKSEASSGEIRPELNLLMNLPELGSRLSTLLDKPDSDITADDVLNAFLLAAGLQQVAEDHLHREAFFIKRAERLSTAGPGAAARLARVATTAIRGAAALRQSRQAERRVERWSENFAWLLDRLSTTVADRRVNVPQEVRAQWRVLQRSIEHFPSRLLTAPMRLPNPLYSFDQAPEDLRALANRFGSRWPDRHRPLLVVGARTSGTYLAPLLASFLRALGYSDVRFLTVRPRQRWHTHEVAKVERTIAKNGLILVTDDPPLAGAALGRLAQELQRYGTPSDSLILLLALFGPVESLPTSLGPYQAVLLPWSDWSIQKRLDPAEVARDLSELLVGRDVRVDARTIHVTAIPALERVDPQRGDEADYRGHVSATYRARFVDEAGTEHEAYVDVQGVGLGYFADHVGAIADALAEYVPQVYGIKSGLLYQQHLPDAWRIDPSGTAGIETRIVSYMLDRHKRLRLAVDPTPRLEGYAIWRVVADLLGTALSGPTRSFVYPLTHAASKRILKVARPSLVDGRIYASAWFVVPESTAANALKMDWHGSSTCYDTVFDLASATADFDIEELVQRESLAGSRAKQLCLAYEGRANKVIDAERLFLYELSHNQHRLEGLSSQLGSREFDASDGRADALVARSLATERALAAANQRYYEQVFFEDLRPPDAGDLCAFDIDGVLETRWLDFPAITPAGALALRALTRHGFRPIIATGRSLSDVQRRCRAYRIAGGVAEYGAVVYDHLHERVLPRLTAHEEEELLRLREALTQLPGVYLDEHHSYSVRAVRCNERGRRRGLTTESIEEALSTAGVDRSVQVMSGRFQTDFVPVSTNKGRGIALLADSLQPVQDGDRPLAFAMGDDWPDVRMLELARSAFAPANMGQMLQQELQSSLGLSVTRDPRGAGVLQAVQSFLGHDPRHCGTCAPSRFSGNRRLVVTALAGSDGPRRVRLRQATVLAWLLLSDGARSAKGLELLNAERER
jgi:hydroxymethylpyrimidine pyrophosphatase-like HAD family hydrolase